MSQFRRAEIAKFFTDWATTGRYNAPRDFRGNENAEREELEGLISVLMKMAPQSNYMPWLREMLDRLESQLKARVWPNKNELGAVCSNLRKERPEPRIVTDAPDMSAAAIFARQMQRGEPVGVGALYGIVACEIVARGLIDEATMRSYRSGWYLSRKATYDEETARRDEAEQIAKHDAAKEIWRQRNDEKRRRDLRVPDKSTPIPEGFAA